MILTDETFKEIKDFRNQFAIYMHDGEVFYIPKGKKINFTGERMIAYSEKRGSIEILEFSNIEHFIIDGKRIDCEPKHIELNKWQRFKKFFKINKKRD